MKKYLDNSGKKTNLLEKKYEILVTSLISNEKRKDGKKMYNVYTWKYYVQ